MKKAKSKEIDNQLHAIFGQFHYLGVQAGHW